MFSFVGRMCYRLKRSSTGGWNAARLFIIMIYIVLPNARVYLLATKGRRSMMKFELPLFLELNEEYRLKPLAKSGTGRITTENIADIGATRAKRMAARGKDF